MESAGFSLNETLEIQSEDGKIILTSVNRRLTLEERIEKYGPIRPFPEMDWGKPDGDERW